MSSSYGNRNKSLLEHVPLPAYQISILLPWYQTTQLLSIIVLYEKLAKLSGLGKETRLVVLWIYKEVDKWMCGWEGEELIYYSKLYTRCTW